MEGTTLHIQNSSRAHAESLHLLLADYETELVQRSGAWQVEVQLGELATALIKLFDALGSWLDSEQVDSLLLHFGERQYTLLRPSKERLTDSNAFLLERVAQLETALNSRIVIEQAKGILAHAFGVSVEEAFSRLRTAARGRGAKHPRPCRGHRRLPYGSRDDAERGDRLTGRDKQRPTGDGA
jgi:ANTAR domain-containing protein